MARTPKSKKEDTHDRIVAVAAKALRRHGYAGTGVAAVMREAGLTHGGFYAHFGSRDALLAEAVERAGQESTGTVRRAVEHGVARGISPFRAMVEAYLADDLLGSLEGGCPIAALGCDMPRQSKAVRKASTKGVQKLISGVHATLPSVSEATAAAVTGTLVGSLQMGRTMGDTPAGRALLAGVRDTLIREYDRSPRSEH